MEHFPHRRGMPLPGIPLRRLDARRGAVYLFSTTSNGSGRGCINKARNLPGIPLGFFLGIHAHSMHCRVDSSEYKTLRGNTSSAPLGVVESRHFS